jgi:hypothetical protein
VDPELRPLALDENELVALEAYLRALQNAGGPVAAGLRGLAFSNHGAIPGARCVGIHEAADAHGWDDNFLCSAVDRGLVWSSVGPIASLRCTAVAEGAEPPASSWNDNWLCLPVSSSLQLFWSMAGPLPGRSCVRFHEPRDPYTWGDNYLCWEDGAERQR